MQLKTRDFAIHGIQEMLRKPTQTETPLRIHPTQTTPTIHQTETLKPNKHPETHEHAETPPQTLDTSHYTEKQRVNGRDIAVLKPEVYEALVSYANHPDRLTRVVAADKLHELRVRKEAERRVLEQQQKPSVIQSGNYPQGWDNIVATFEAKYQAEENQILQQFAPQTKELAQTLLNDR